MEKMKLALVAAAVGALCFVWDGALGSTCASFDIPEPEHQSGVETKVLWGQSYCKQLTLAPLNGKTPKLCVRNENPKISGGLFKEPTGCLRLKLRHVDPTLIKELRVGIHPDCGVIPTEIKEKFQRVRNRAKLALGKEMNAIRICFDDIPAASTCCETEQCLVFEAVVEVESVDTEVTIEDDTCISDEGCPYSIGCPNLISERNCPECGENGWVGTNGNDLIIITEGEDIPAKILPFYGYDVVIGTDSTETVSIAENELDSTTLLLKGGDDIVTLGDEVLEKIYLGKGDDIVFDVYSGFSRDGGDGLQDLIYGGGGENLHFGYMASEDVLDNMSYPDYGT